MRLLAAVMIILCAWLAGQSAADRLARRCRLLEQLCGFADRMQAQISYALVPPARIIRDSDDGEGGFFRCCIELMDKGADVNSAWSSAAENCSDVIVLKRNERAVLGELGKNLGIYDAELQLIMLERFGNELHECRKAAREEYRERSRLLNTCSLLAGILLAILII